MSLPIHDATTACRNHFERLRDSKWHNGHVELVAWLQRQSIEFNLWSHSSGALAIGRYSLDGKLCLRKPLQSTISNLLWILDGLLADDGQLAHQQQDQARQDVEETLADIVTLTATARNALPFSGIWDPDEVNVSLLPSAREEIDVIKEEQSQRHGSSEDGRQPFMRRPVLISSLIRQDSSTAPSHTQQIHDRLIDANEKRRSRFNLARERWEERGRPQPAEIPTTWPPRSKFMLPAVPVVPASSSSFVCPYCYDLLPAYFAEEHAWREHIISDLAPYTCIIPTCSQPSRLYARREEWMDHMLNDAHGDKSRKYDQHWRCLLCEEHLYDNQSYINHFEIKHRSELETSGVTASMAVHLCPEPMLEMVLATCPVCRLNERSGEPKQPYNRKGSPKPQEQDADEATREELVDHVAWCLEVFAMKAISPPDSTAMKPPVGGRPNLNSSFSSPLVTGIRGPPSEKTVDVPLPQLLPPELFTGISGEPGNFVPGMLDFLDEAGYFEIQNVPLNVSSIFKKSSILRYLKEINLDELLKIGLPAPYLHQWIARETISEVRSGFAPHPSGPLEQHATTDRGKAPFSIIVDRSSQLIKYDQRSELSRDDQIQHLLDSINAKRLSGSGITLDSPSIKTVLT